MTNITWHWRFRLFRWLDICTRTTYIAPQRLSHLAFTLSFSRTAFHGSSNPLSSHSQPTPLPGYQRIQVCFSHHRITCAAAFLGHQLPCIRAAALEKAILVLYSGYDIKVSQKKVRRVLSPDRSNEGRKRKMIPSVAR